MFVGVAPLSQPSSRDLCYPLWDIHVPKMKTVLYYKKTTTVVYITLFRKILVNMLALCGKSEIYIFFSMIYILCLIF